MLILSITMLSEVLKFPKIRSLVLSFLYLEEACLNASINKQPHVYFSLNTQSEHASSQSCFSSLLTLDLKNVFGKKKLTLKRCRTMCASLKLTVSAIWDCVVFCCLPGTQTIHLQESSKECLNFTFFRFFYWLCLREISMYIYSVTQIHVS